MNHLLQNRYVRWLVIFPVLAIAAGYGWFQYKFPTCTFRYKLTAEVMTPEGVKTGSSVIEVSYSHNADWGGGQSADLNMIGEAVYVDLGLGKNLFVTLRSHESGRAANREREYAPLVDALDAYEVPLKAFGLNWIFGEERALCAAVRNIPRDQVNLLPFENLPTLLTFKDVNDPYSVRVIQPNETEKTIGVGFAIQNVWTEITELRPTEHILGVLPWLNEKRPTNGVVVWRKGDPLIDRLHFTSFKMPI